MEDLKSFSSNFEKTELNSEKFSSGKVYSIVQMDDKNNNNNNNNNNSIPSRTKASLPENLNTYFVNYGSVFSAQKKP
jgi:hypothetical protein